MILDYQFFIESQIYRHINLDLIKDLFQEYIDKYGFNEVTFSVPWRDMEIMDFKIYIQNPSSVYSYELRNYYNNEKNSQLGVFFVLIDNDILSNINKDLLLLCERLKKFGYWCNLQYKSFQNKGWIYIYFYKENDVIYESKSDYLANIIDLFQEYIDEYKLKKVYTLSPISDMKDGEYKLVPDSNKTTLIICGHIPNIENYYRRLLKFGYYCTFEEDITNKNKFQRGSTERLFTKIVISNSKSIFESKLNDTLYIFDFDDTLVLNPRFEDLAIEYLKEDITIKSLLLSSIRKIGVRLSDLKWENGRIFVNDPEQKIDVKSEWVRKGRRVYLTAPDKFYFTDMSMPIDVTKLTEFYNRVENKAIVTGRHDDINHKVLNSLKEHNLDIPNYGLHCYPGKRQTEQKIGEWKAKTIVDIIKKTNFSTVHFYDDNSKWVNKATSIVKKELPHINWVPIKYKHQNG